MSPKVKLIPVRDWRHFNLRGEQAPLLPIGAEVELTTSKARLEASCVPQAFAGKRAVIALHADERVRNRPYRIRVTALVPGYTADNPWWIAGDCFAKAWVTAGLLPHTEYL